MTFKLDKGEVARKAALVEQLNAQYDILEEEISAYYVAENVLRRPVEEALEKYNEVVSDALGFAQDVAARAESEIDEKSEKWQEGEKCEAATGWKDAWESYTDLEELEIEWPEEFEIEADHASMLDELPDDADSV